MPPSCSAAPLFSLSSWRAPDDVLTVLSQFIQSMDASAGFLAGHPSASEAIGFFGADWINHLYLAQPPFTADDFTFVDIVLDVRWSEGAPGVSFELAVESVGPGDRVWTMDATGALDETSGT